MPMHIRVDDQVVFLSNLARLMNDPRYSSAGDEIGDLLDQELRAFVLELKDVRETGAPFLGLRMTRPRRIRQAGGEVVVARPSREIGKMIEEMQMDEFWDVFPSIEEAKAFFKPASGSQESPG